MSVDAVLTATISGAFSLASAFGSIWLKDYLERRRSAIPRAPATPPTPSGSPAAPAPAPDFSQARPSATRRSAALVPILLLIGGFFVGIISRVVRGVIGGPYPHYDALFSIVTLGVICLWLTLASRGSRRGFWPYQLNILTLYAAFASGWSVANAGIRSDLVTGVIFLWLVSAIVGGIIVVIPKRTAE